MKNTEYVYGIYLIRAVEEEGYSWVRAFREVGKDESPEMFDEVEKVEGRFYVIRFEGYVDPVFLIEGQASMTALMSKMESLLADLG